MEKKKKNTKKIELDSCQCHDAQNNLHTLHMDYYLTLFILIHRISKITQ